MIDLESEEEMQDDDEPEEEEDDIPREGIGASAAELASIDLELGVEKEWIQVEWEVQKVGKNVEDVSERTTFRRYCHIPWIVSLVEQ